MRLRGFYIGRAQRVAGLLLLMLLGECLWTIGHEPLDANDYRYAHCGREMWESPSVLQGYFTTCGNLNGDGTLGSIHFLQKPYSPEKLMRAVRQLLDGKAALDRDVA